MKKIALAALLFCLSCSHKVPTPTPQMDATPPVCTGTSCPLPKVDPTDLIQEDNWQFAIGSGWTPKESPDPIIKVVFLNEKLSTMIFFAKDPTKLSLSDYIITVLQTFKSAGITVQSAKSVKINGTLFILVAGHDDDRSIWTWINVQKENGYVFSCVIEDPDAGSMMDRCSAIANSIQIK